MTEHNGERSDRHVAALVSAWLTAARELGLELELDVQLLSNDGEAIAWPVRVIGFGTPRGMVIRLHDTSADDLRLLKAAQAAGFGCSFLSPSYETYDRDLFESTLNDWGWSGIGAAPPWYTGAPWT